MERNLLLKVAASLVVSGLACVLVAQDAAGTKTSANPPEKKPSSPNRAAAPSVVYEAMPGLWVVRLMETDQLAEGQDDVIADAARRWSGPNLDAFNICYHATHSGIAPNGVFSALKLVAQRLKSRGAKIVVTLGDICTPSFPNVPARGAYVKIAGVYRL